MLKMSLRKVKATLRASIEGDQVNVVYLVLLFLNYFAYAFSTKIITYTVTDLTHIYQVPPWEVEYLFIPIYIGFIFGSFSNYLHRYLNRQLALVGFILLMSVANCLLPHYGRLSLAYVAKGLNGFCSGAWECGNSIWLIEMVPQYFATALQMDQLVYNIGAFGTIYLIDPFLWGDVVVDGASNQTVTIMDRRKALAVPFLLNGFLQAMVPCILLTLYFVAPYQKPTPTHSVKQKSPALPSNGIYEHTSTTTPFRHRHSTRKYKMALSAVSCILHYSAEIAYLYYCPLLFEAIGLTEGQSETAYTILYVTGILGPLIFMALFIRHKPEAVVPFQFAVEIAALLVQYFYQEDLLVVYGTNVLLGLVISTVHPAILAFIEINLQLDERDISTYTLMSGIAMLITPFGVKALKRYSTHCIFIYEALTIPTSFALFMIAKWWILGWNDPFCTRCFVRRTL